MKTLMLTFCLVFVVSSASAHSIKSAYCNGQFPVGEPKLDIVVRSDGSISGTGGGRAIPFTAKVKPDETVDFYRPDGSLWYESVTMTNDRLFATYHQEVAKGGTVGKFNIPCTMR